MKSKTKIATNKIRKWLTTQDMTERELAQELGVTKSHISKILCGVHGVSVDVLFNLSKLTNMSMEELTSL